MVKEIKGPWGVILVGPGAVNTPYKPWDRNQGTYLAIALAVPLLLTLLSTLSVPIIPGAYTVKVTPYNKLGEVVYGTWSIGVKGDSIKDIVTDNFTPWPVIGGNETLLALPLNKWNLDVPVNTIDNVLPQDYQLATGIMHALAVTFAWLASTTALAASGEWHAKSQKAWAFNRWAWGSEKLSMVFCIVPWALEIAMYTKIKGYAKMAGSEASGTVKVTAGPTIYMMSAAVASHIILALVRVFWSKKEPRPTWTLEAAGDFHSAPPAGAGLHGDRRGSGGLAPLAVVPYGAGMGGNGMGMPNSAALPGNDDKPPAWENLNLDSSIQVTDEKYWPPTEYDDAIPVSAAQARNPALTAAPAPAEQTKHADAVQQC